MFFLYVKFSSLSDEEYNEFITEFPRPEPFEFVTKNIKLKLTEILLHTGIQTKNYYYLIDVLINAEHGSYNYIPIANNKYIYIICRVSFNLLISNSEVCVIY